MIALYFISHRFSNTYTGGEFYNSILLKGAAKAGFQVECWEGDKYGFLKKHIVIMNCIYLVKALFMCMDSYLLLDMDFHARYILALLWARYIKKAKIIVMLHHYNYVDKNNYLSRNIHFVLEKYVSNRCDMVITNSNFSIEHFRSIARKDTPFFIHPPFTCNRNEIPKERVHFDPDCQRLLIVGSIERRKNIVATIKSFALLTRPFTCDIIGFRPSKQYFYEVKEIIRVLSFEKNVFMHGNLSRYELLKKYSEATIFILVSRMEGYGMAYAEAMTFGLPIIGTTRGAVPELVEEGINGFLCDPDDIEQIAAAIEKLGNRETWESLSMNNLKKSKEFKSKAQFESDSCELFRKILALSPSKRKHI